MNLRGCFDELRANTASGIDGIIQQQYENNLLENLQLLELPTGSRCQTISDRHGNQAQPVWSGLVAGENAPD